MIHVPAQFKVNVERPVFAGDRNPGRRGGIVSSLRLSPAQREARASKAGTATLQSYGRDFYSALARTGNSKREKGSQETKA